MRLLPAFHQGVFRLTWNLDRLQSLVDVGDVAEVAAAVLLDSERHLGATYELVAPGRYTAHELAKVISEVLGRDVSAERIDSEVPPPPPPRGPARPAPPPPATAVTILSATPTCSPGSWVANRRPSPNSCEGNTTASWK